MCLCDRFLTGPDCLEVDKAVRVKIHLAGAQQTLTLKVRRMPDERTAEASSSQAEPAQGESIDPARIRPAVRKSC